MERAQLIESLRWKKFPVLDDGFVCLVDVMGDDSSVVQAARVSYGNDERMHVGREEFQAKLKELFPNGGDSEYVNPGGEYVWSNHQIRAASQALKEESLEKDRHTLRYLMRHRHTTPFEMAEVKILVRVPMDCWRQWIRHRTANVNEYSTRYTEAIDSQQKTKPNEWRLQATSNKQGSEGFLPVDNGGVAGAYLTEEENDLQAHAIRVYQERLDAGVAKEQARKDLPLSTYTEAYWKCDLHNILHFLGLRMDSHAQKEIRDYATILGEQIIKPLFPLVWEAFEDYRLGGLFLSRLDQDVIKLINLDKEVNGSVKLTENSLIWPKEWRHKKVCRERDECLKKLQRLGLVQ